MAVFGLVEHIAEVPESLHLWDDLKTQQFRLVQKLLPLLSRHRLWVNDGRMALVWEAVIHFHNQCVELLQRQPMQQFQGKR